MNGERVLGVFAKWPKEGAVKTRLAAARTASWAVRVADAFLGDTLDRSASLGTRRVIAFTPEESHDQFQAISAGRYALFPQGSGDLGDRLNRFFGHYFAVGATAVVAIGADSPTLPLAYLEQAFAQLEFADIVVGPAVDGGFYLLGSRRPFDSLLCGIKWGGKLVLRQTVERLHASSLSVSLLPPWYDVDDAAAWEFLASHVAAMRCAGIDPGAPRTESLLQGG